MPQVTDSPMNVVSSVQLGDSILQTKSNGVDVNKKAVVLDENGSVTKETRDGHGINL